jgi:hypothetical protein
MVEEPANRGVRIRKPGVPKVFRAQELRYEIRGHGIGVRADMGHDVPSALVVSGNFGGFDRIHHSMFRFGTRFGLVFDG